MAIESSILGVTIAGVSSAVNEAITALETILTLSPKEYCSFTKRNRALLERLMKYNITMQEARQNNFGAHAAYEGNSLRIDKDQALDNGKTDEIDYIKSYATKTYNEITRSHVTSRQTTSYTNHNELYTYTKNRFPNDLNVSNSTIKNSEWYANNERGILSKTQKLFHNHKINTLISRFGTAADDHVGITSNGDAITKYGMSHGRNLLKKSAETGEASQSYTVNGYNNPYCRVWTHHYQYDKLGKMIRPFSTTDDEGGSNYETKTNSELHTWSNFQTPTDSEGRGWKNDSDGKIGWNLSVLDNNGMVNITPKYKGGGKNNIHTKQCMFSIENLAWKGYSPYSFEKALSWEQRGPMGGRIMWFPPYGIKFSETSSVGWTSHSFIGRGEEVYTYTNTTRSGTLSFMMVVDHPSITDYVTWMGNDTTQDTDLLRFFAGCDSDTLIENAQPTPLTDEETEVVDDEDTNEEPASLPEEESVVNETKTITFYVFFPNNYSGYYDRTGKNVECVAYLLQGKGAQKQSGDNYEKDEDIAFKDVIGDSDSGYEMLVSMGESGSESIIYGTTVKWASYSGATYPVNKNREWYYRIDGEYSVPSSVGNEQYRNTYDQILLKDTNYTDNKCYSLNLSASNVADAFSIDTENLYSLAEVATALMSEEAATSFMGVFNSIESERVEELRTAFDEYEIISVESLGYSNSHGNNASTSVNTTRNNLLAQQRAESVIDWLKNALDSDINDVCTSSIAEAEVAVASSDISSKEAKKWRSSKVTITFNKTSVTTLSETEQTSTDENGNTTIDGYQDSILYNASTASNGQEYYIDGNSNKWAVVDNELQMIELSPAKEITTIVDMENETEDSTTEEEISSVNTIRYDQEYYFFKELKANSPLVYDKLMEKLQYFDPAYHSMSPEGFNARLTFLQQCTRQGNTISGSDDSSNASNLAFGRPPFCVLRLGDFYNQMIVIDSVNVNYETTWDLNPEGAGVQPMLATVSLNFKFIGGGDLAGPVRRLQNAMSFNYYANARLYDNRADRVAYNWDDKTGGAIDNEIDNNSSYYYSPQMYNEDDG